MLGRGGFVLLLVLLGLLRGSSFSGHWRGCAPPVRRSCSRLHCQAQQPLPSPPPAQLEIVEFDHIGTPHSFRWDSSSSKLAPVALPVSKRQRLRHFLTSCFLPSGGELSADYYRYSTWRALQRLVSATNTVFGTQALLLALGLRRKRIGLAAATSWVLKDALGKMSRIFWASKFGRRFDSNAKKWRLRSALLFSTGNVLEIVTFAFPRSFLVLAALATACKQMAMLTSSSTRNAIYKSFSKSVDNIGDVTAKGEAQAAVIDLIGLAIGVLASKLMTAPKHQLVALTLLLTSLDVFCVHPRNPKVRWNRRLSTVPFLLSSCDLAAALHFNSDPFVSSAFDCPSNSVVFNTLNFDRANAVLSALLRSIESTSRGHQEPFCPSPAQVSQDERLFLSPAPNEHMFTSWSQLATSPASLSAAMEVVQAAAGAGDKFAILWEARELPSQWDRILLRFGGRSTWVFLAGRVAGPQLAVQPRVLLHRDATASDIFAALVVIHKVLLGAATRFREGGAVDGRVLQQQSAQARQFERCQRDAIHTALRAAGWDLSRSAFGAAKYRVVW